jgi:hypothetical protein
MDVTAPECTMIGSGCMADKVNVKLPVLFLFPALELELAESEFCETSIPDTTRFTPAGFCVRVGGLKL